LELWKDVGAILAGLHVQRLDATALLRAAGAEDAPSSLMEPLGRVLGSEGKGIRPAILLEAASRGPNPGTSAVRRAATAVELLHVATMTHDDVIDRGDRRRGVPTVTAEHGCHTAVTVGVWLLGRVAELLIDCGPGALASASTSIVRMCDGQIAEARDMFNPDRTIDDYLRAIEGKTAELFALSAQLGAQLGEADPATILALKNYGRELGIAYQIADDLRDLTHDDAATGRRAGNDLRQGIYTLPIIYALQAQPDLRNLLTATPTTRDTARIIDIATHTGAIDRAREDCHRHTTAAQAALNQTPPAPTHLLKALPELILKLAGGALSEIVVPTAGRSAP
jgi:heptaprenyl diphosphate synthase